MKRVLILVGLVAFLGLAGVLVFLSATKAPRNTTVIGGVTVSVIDVLPAGKTFTTVKKWHPWVRKVLPARFQKWIPFSSSGSCSSGSNSVTVYLELASPSAPWMGQLPWENYRAESLDGEVFAGEGGSCSFGGGMAGAPRIHGLALRAFPRRDKEFILRFTKYDGTQLGSIRVPNPVKGPFPNWKPLPMPQVITNGDVTLTLRSLTMRGPTNRPYISPDYMLDSGNPNWNGIRVTYTTYLDATGNEGFPLSKREPAWRIRAIVHRSEARRMLDEEKLVLANLAAPADGTFAFLSTNTVLAGVGLRTAVISGRGTLYRTNSTGWAAEPFTQNEAPGYSTSGSSSYGNTEVHHWGFGRPFLLLETDSATMPDGTQLFYHAFDADGRELGPEQSNGYSTDKNGWQTRAVSFEKWTNGTLSRLEILVSRPKIFEFLVNPADTKTNTAAR